MNIQNRLRRRLGPQYLGLVLALSGSWVGALALSAAAQTNQGLLTTKQVAQVEAVQITDVRVEATDTGLQVVLETADGTPTEPTTSVSGDALILEISNAVLVGDGFEEFAPAEGIAVVQVSELSDSRVQVAIKGTDAVPTADVNTDVTGLVLSVMPGITQAGETREPLRIVVTGEEYEGYNPSSAVVGTRTDTPLRDIPQSIRIVPQDVIEDQRATTPLEVLQNVPGVVPSVSPRGTFNQVLIRGFGASENILVNGTRDNTNQIVTILSNVERVEVLRGPASVLFGQGTIGGTVNYVTKQPLSEPFFSLEASAGNFSLYGGSIDLSGPLDEEQKVLYRLNASAETSENFVDFYDIQRYQVAPVLSWQIGDRTNLTLEADYSERDAPADFGIPAEGTILPNPNGEIDRGRFLGEPEFNSAQNRVFRVGYDLEHQFSDNWQLRSALKAAFLNFDRETVFPTFLDADQRTINRGYNVQDYQDNIYDFDNYVVGEFSTGNIQHQLVAGLNLNRQDTDVFDIGFEIAPLDIFNPSYGNSTPTDAVIFESDITNRTQGLGLYVQDQISFGDQFIVLLGGRYDIASQDFENAANGTEDFREYDAFSPRIGVVYKPIEPISLYASYNRSFQQTTTFFRGALGEPERGTQYEVGLKADIADGLSATLAYYDLTRSNVETSDPNNPTQNIQVGEQRSRGIELDIGGEILPGWNIFAGYAYTDAEITRDNNLTVGNQLNNIPEHAFNIWTTYEIQEGDLDGLGFGLGLFYTGDRQGDLANTFSVPSYLRTDAAVFYKRNNFRAALNFRNLFDADYFVSAQNRNRVFPGEPFTLVGSISWEF
ncbi:MAG: TonB-dependent siderophore receptor [Cyanobacteria bacterium P01_H01_bin.21]